MQVLIIQASGTLKVDREERVFYRTDLFSAVSGNDALLQKAGVPPACKIYNLLIYKVIKTI